MSGRKIFNDPVYGLISFPSDLIYRLIDHPYFQRLRRIQQVGLSSLVYPGATHTRFHHALGATHLCDRLLTQLIRKGIQVSNEEYEAALIAILLHDIGHGPYSHALEGEILPLHHEGLSTLIMDRLNSQFDNRLELAIQIYNKTYYRSFLSQIISGQVDVDRMDYLNRDSFYTGVAEGIIGYDRIIKMMTVIDDQLVIEEKGIHSVEKFLMSRYFMYQQVYLHHASLSADHMLKIWLKEYKDQLQKGNIEIRSTLDKALIASSNDNDEDGIDYFLDLDDTDIFQAIKRSRYFDLNIIQTLAENIVNRRLHGISSKGKPWTEEEISDLHCGFRSSTEIDNELFVKLINLGQEQVQLYDYEDEIRILQKNSGEVVTLSDISRLNLHQTPLNLYFITYPKI